MTRPLFSTGTMLCAIVALSVFPSCTAGRPIPNRSTRYVIEPDTRFAPPVEETASALDLVANRANEIIDVTPSEARTILDRVTVVYTSDSLNTKDTLPGYMVTGYSYGYLVLVKCDKTRHNVSTNALVHELVHVLLWAKLGNPEKDHIGRWTNVTYNWIDALMNELEVPQVLAPEALPHVTFTSLEKP